MYEPTDWEEKLRRWMSWVAVVSTVLFSIIVGAMVIDAGFHGFWDGVLQEHVVTVVGLPVAAMLALAIVLLLRTVAGAIELKFLGFEFKGAAGPIVMWIMCFVA